MVSDQGTGNPATYYYVSNLQGDIIKLVDASGTTVATYDYDPYGKVISSSGSFADINPLRYRGYYYDIESGLYYLQSRFYDPSIRRFINPDEYASTGKGIIGHNMFVYCENSPISQVDIYGHLATSTLIAAGVGGIVNAVCEIVDGGNLSDIAKAFCIGAVEGGLCHVQSAWKVVFTTVHVVSAFWNSYKSGAGLGTSLFSGALELAAATFFVPSMSDGIDAVVDLTFGLGTAMTVQSINSGIVQNSTPAPEITPSTGENNEDFEKKPVKRPTFKYPVVHGKFQTITLY